MGGEEGKVEQAMVASEGQLSLHIQERRALILTSRARMLMNG